jgi:hypothetical protein
MLPASGWSLCFLHFDLGDLGDTFLRLGIVVGIATGYGLDDFRGRISSPDRVKNFLFSKLSRPALGFIQPPIQLIPGALSPGVKQPVRESPASAENVELYVHSPIRLHGVYA